MTGACSTDTFVVSTITIISVNHVGDDDQRVGRAEHGEDSLVFREGQRACEDGVCGAHRKVLYPRERSEDAHAVRCPIAVDLRSEHRWISVEEHRHGIGVCGDHAHEELAVVHVNGEPDHTVRIGNGQDITGQEAPPRYR